MQEKLREIDNRVASLEALRSYRITHHEALVKEVEQLTADADLLTKTEQVLLHISTKLLGQSTQTVDKLLTTGLRIVFDDQNLEFRTVTDKMRGKTAIKFQLLDNGRSTPIMDSYGGGVLVVAGVLLRVVTITALGLRRVLFLDESLSMVSSQYLDNTSRLLRKLCDELDFQIVLVTHQEELAAHATSRYRAEAQGGATVFVKE